MEIIHKLEKTRETQIHYQEYNSTKTDEEEY